MMQRHDVYRDYRGLTGILFIRKLLKSIGLPGLPGLPGTCARARAFFYFAKHLKKIPCVR